MKRYLYLLLTFSVFFITACNKFEQKSAQYAQNKQQLIRISEKAQQHIPIIDESGIDSLDDFFCEYGTEEDAFCASFYKGVYLQQLGDDKSAFNQFLTLYNNRPSNETPLIRSITVKILDYFLTRYIRDKDIEKLRWWIAEADDVAGYDERISYALFQRKAYLYIILEKPDSALHYMDLAFDNMMQYSEWDQNKSMILTEMAGWYAQRGEHDEFMKLYEVLKRHPYKGKSSSTDFYAGLYYNQMGQRDSAEVCFQRATNSSAEVARQAYVQLATMAHHNAEHDSVFAYFQGYVSACDSLLLHQQAESTQKLEAAFKSREQESQIDRQHIFILSLLVLLLSVTLVAIVAWRVVITIKRRMLEKTKELENERLQKERLLVQLQMALDGAQHESNEIANARIKLLEDKLATMRVCLADKTHGFKDIEIQELSQLFVKAYPHFVQNITEVYPRFKPYDIILCVLALNDFGHTDIGRILQKERQQISNAIRRISQGLVGENTSRMETFKKILQEFLV